MPARLHSPPLTCTAKSRHHLQLLCRFCCEAGHLWPFVLRPVPGGESAGCGCLQLPCSAGCVPAVSTLCLPCPLPINILPPFSLLCPVHCVLLAPVHPCAPGSSVRASSLFLPTRLQAAKLSRWQLQHGPAVAARAPVHLILPFSLQSP